VDVPNRKSVSRSGSSHHSLFGHPAGIEISCGDSNRWTSSAYDNRGNLLKNIIDDGVIVTPVTGGLNHSRSWASRIFDSFQESCVSCENVLTMLLAKRIKKNSRFVTIPDVAPSNCVLRLLNATGNTSSRRTILSSETSYTSTLLTRKDVVLTQRPCLRVTSFITPRPKLNHDRVLSCGNQEEERKEDLKVKEDLERIETIRRKGRHVMRDFEGEEISVVQVSDLVRESIPGIDLMMKPIVNIVVSPIANQLAFIIKTEMGDQLSGALLEGIGADVPPKVAMYVGAQVTYALNGILIDSVTHRTTESMTRLASDTLGPLLSTEIHRRVVPKLQSRVSEIVSDTVSNRIESSVVNDVSRSLLYSLTDILTRSVTHSVVPTLSATLNYHADTELFCKKCLQHEKDCEKCPFSAVSSYYNSYYSTYYSDYYSNYYADYYMAAVREVDKVFYPKGDWKQKAASPSSVAFEKAKL